MGKVFKYFSFWLSLVALSICIFNITGYDDKNLLLYFTSPPLWLLENYSPFMERFISKQLVVGLFYVVTILFWYSIGLIIDLLIHRSNRKQIRFRLFKMGIASGIVAIVFIVFYTYQNSEQQISTILKNPDRFNQQSLQIAVIRSAKEGYGGKYIEEMETILKSSNNRELKGSTLYALGIIGTPAAIKTMVEYGDGDAPESILYSLQINIETIMSMLEMNQSHANMSAGIKAATLLGYRSFIRPLQKISDEHPDQQLQEQAKKALMQIQQNPKENHPKFNSN